MTYERLLPSSSPVFGTDRLDRDLVRDFMFMFARAEYALKAAHFVRGDKKRYGAPSIQWSAFGLALGDRLFAFPDQAVGDAVRYLEDHPPLRQIIHEASLEWMPRVRKDLQTASQFLIDSVTVVRNNLFHGGKNVWGPLAERDRQLIRASLLVLAFAISLDDHVMAAFEDDGGNSAVD